MKLEIACKTCLREYPPHKLLLCPNCKSINCYDCTVPKTVMWKCYRCNWSTESKDEAFEYNFHCPNCFRCPLCDGIAQIDKFSHPDSDEVTFCVVCQSVCHWNSAVEEPKAEGITASLAKKRAVISPIPREPLTELTILHCPSCNAKLEDPIENIHYGLFKSFPKVFIGDNVFFVKNIEGIIPIYIKNQLNKRLTLKMTLYIPDFFCEISRDSKEIQLFLEEGESKESERKSGKCCHLRRSRRFLLVTMNSRER